MDVVSANLHDRLFENYAQNVRMDRTPAKSLRLTPDEQTCAPRMVFQSGKIGAFEVSRRGSAALPTLRRRGRRGVARAQPPPAAPMSRPPLSQPARPPAARSRPSASSKNPLGENRR